MVTAFIINTGRSKRKRITWASIRAFIEVSRWFRFHSNGKFDINSYQANALTRFHIFTCSHSLSTVTSKGCFEERNSEVTMFMLNR